MSNNIFVVNSPVVFIKDVSLFPNTFKKMNSIALLDANRSDLESVETDKVIAALYLDVSQINEDITPKNLEAVYFDTIKGFAFINSSTTHAKIMNFCFTDFIWSTTPTMENPITDIFLKSLKNLGENMTIRTYLNVQNSLWDYFMEALKICKFQHPVITINSQEVDPRKKYNVQNNNIKIRFLRVADTDISTYDALKMESEANKLRSRFIASKLATPPVEPSTPKKKDDWMTKTTLAPIYKNSTRTAKYVESKKTVQEPKYEIKQKSKKDVIRDVAAPTKLEPVKFFKGQKVYATSFLESINSKLHPQIDINMRNCHSMVK